jgi:WD40 repeat protein
MGEFADKFAGEKLFCQRAYLGSLLPSYVKSGNLGKYYEKLTDFNFLMAKIQHPDFGLQALIDDFDLVDDSEALTHPEYNSQKVKALNLIQAVLWMSGDILTLDKTQLAGQLLGRLLHFNIPAIQGMAEVAKQWKAAPWLRPLTSCLTPPGRGLLRTLNGHSSSVNAVAVTADGKRAISGSHDKTLKAWDLTTGQEQFTLNGHTDWIYVVAVTADGKRAISGSDDNTLKVWDLTTRKEQFTLNGHSSSVNAVAVTADGKRAISGSHDKTLKVWDLTTGQEQFTLNGHTDWIYVVAVTADGKRAISGSDDNTLKVWDLTTRKEQFTLNGHTSSVYAVAVTADGKRAISGSDDNTLKVWDLTTRKEQFTLNGHTSSVYAVAVTADGKRAISGSYDKTLKVWDLTTRKEQFTLNGHTSSVNAVAVTADGKRAISGSYDNTLKAWDLTTRKEQFTLKGHSISVKAVAVTADGKRAISGSDDKTLKVWDLTTGKKQFTLKGHTSLVNAVAVTPDGKRAISGSGDKTLKVWDLTSGKEQFTLNGHTSFVNAVAVTADGKRAISGSYDNTLKVWDLTTGKEQFTLNGHTSSVYAVAVTADGKRAISGSGDKTLKVWDLTTGKEQFTLNGHTSSVNAVAVTGDGNRAISSSWDKTLKVWDLTTRKEQFTLNGHTSSVNAVAVTGDGNRAISGSRDKTIKVWDLSRGNVIASFTGESSIASCAIAPDGVTIVAGDTSGRVHFLRLEGMEELTNSSPLPTPISTAAYPKEFQQLLREKTENFVGRKFVFSAISNFLNSHSRGYFTIVGTPGCGKSSILAQYVTAHPRSIYYNAAVEGKNRAEDFLASVCTQLIDKYLVANGETSEIVKLRSQLQNLESHDGSWFLSLLLQQISDKLDDRQKLIIVIDSVDAIARTSQPPSTNLFYLPRYLGDRTYFILARRPFLREKSGLLIETPSQTLDLRDYPAQNREDALNYIQQYLSTEPDLTQPEFCQQLATVSENNFMYLSQMLRAIVENSHPDANLGESSLVSELPPGLAAYYQNHWLRMRGDGLSAIELSVLNVLVQSTTGLSVSAISNIIDEDEYEIEKVLDNWIEFLNSQEIRGEICYSLYHASFREWLGKQSILESGTSA